MQLQHDISYIITEKFKYNLDYSYLGGLWNFAHFDFGYNYCMCLQVYVLQTAKPTTEEEGNRHAWSKSSQKSSCKTSATTNAAAKHSGLLYSRFFKNEIYSTFVMFWGWEFSKNFIIHIWIWSVLKFLVMASISILLTDGIYPIDLPPLCQNSVLNWLKASCNNI